MGVEGMWDSWKEILLKVERALRDGFLRPWEAKTSLNDKGFPGETGRLVRMGMREEEGHKGGKEAAQGFPSAAALSSPAKPITMRGTDLQTPGAKDD